MTSGRFEPTRTSPSVSMILRSSSLCCFRFEKSWVEGRVDDTVGRVCGRAQAVQIVHVAAKDLRPGKGERLGTCVRTAEPDYVIARVDEFWNEIGTDKAGCTCQKHSHSALLSY